MLHLPFRQNQNRGDLVLGRRGILDDLEIRKRIIYVDPARMACIVLFSTLVGAAIHWHNCLRYGQGL